MADRVTVCLGEAVGDLRGSSQHLIDGEWTFRQSSGEGLTLNVYPSP